MMIKTFRLINFLIYFIHKPPVNRLKVSNNGFWVVNEIDETNHK